METVLFIGPGLLVLPVSILIATLASRKILETPRKRRGWPIPANELYAGVMFFFMPFLLFAIGILNALERYWQIKLGQNWMLIDEVIVPFGCALMSFHYVYWRVRRRYNLSV